MIMTAKELVELQLATHKKADKDVLTFIFEFALSAGSNTSRYGYQSDIIQTFMNGYCYYFAHMLKLAFNRGSVCLCVPFSHVVWRDTNGVAYDIMGVYIPTADVAYVPEECAGKVMDDFKQVPGVVNNTTGVEIQILYNKFHIEKENINYE